MKDENKLERDLTKGLKFKLGNGFEWIEWSSNKDVIKRNLRNGEKIIEFSGLYVAYRKKLKKVRTK